MRVGNVGVKHALIVAGFVLLSCRQKRIEGLSWKWRCQEVYKHDIKAC